MIPVLALLFAACSVEDSSPKDEDRFGVAERVEDNRFLTIGIISTIPGSRAGDDTKYDQNDGPEYKDGQGAENDVYKVRFYFFTNSGEAAMVKYVADANDGEGDYVSYYDWYPNAEDSRDSADGSFEMKCPIIIDVYQNDRIPFSVVAVLNPSEGYRNSAGSENLSLEELCDVARECKVGQLSQSEAANGMFVMSNSVYAGKTGVVMEAQPVEGHIYATREEAENDPVLIHVERVMARLDLYVTMKALDAGPSNVYNTGISYDSVYDYAGDKPDYKGDTDGNIYVKFLGWNVTATPDKSRLLKHIDARWGEQLFGWADEPWNDPLRFRSYWSVNPDDVRYSYGDFWHAKNGTPDDLREADFGSASKKVSVYLQENAAANNDKGMQEPYDNTKVIIAAQLVMGDGKTPVTIAEWALNYYTLNGVKAVLADNLDLYRRTEAEGGYRYEKIGPDDIEFVSACEQDPTIVTPAENGGAPENVSEENRGRYYVYPVLVSDGSTWTLGEGDEALLLDSYEAADEIVKRLGKVKIWSNGYTYYYFSIAHLGNKGFPGEYGVVRNHIYDAAITSLKGLGIPVYDPEETIYPEKPDNDDSMIAARIQVIKWRLVKKTIQVSW